MNCNAIICDITVQDNVDWIVNCSDCDLGPILGSIKRIQSLTYKKKCFNII